MEMVLTVMFYLGWNKITTYIVYTGEKAKAFLKKILLLELQHRWEGGRWSYGKEYELDMKHYAEKYKGE